MNNKNFKMTNMIRAEETSDLIRGVEENFLKLLAQDKDGNGNDEKMVVLSAEIYNGKITDMPMSLAEIPAPLLRTFAEEALQGKSQEILADAYGKEVMTELVESNPFFFIDCMLPMIMENWNISIPTAVCAFYHLPDGSCQVCFRNLFTQGEQNRSFLIEPGYSVPDETSVPAWVTRFLDGAVNEMPELQQPEWECIEEAV